MGRFRNCGKRIGRLDYAIAITRVSRTLAQKWNNPLVQPIITNYVRTVYKLLFNKVQKKQSTFLCFICRYSEYLVCLHETGFDFSFTIFIILLINIRFHIYTVLPVLLSVCYRLGFFVSTYSNTLGSSAIGFQFRV